VSKNEIKDLLDVFKSLAGPDGLVKKESFRYIFKLFRFVQLSHRDAIKKRYGDDSTTLVYALFNVFVSFLLELHSNAL
jgi:hypothetical protein